MMKIHLILRYIQFLKLICNTSDPPKTSRILQQLRHSLTLCLYGLPCDLKSKTIKKIATMPAKHQIGFGHKNGERGRKKKGERDADSGGSDETLKHSLTGFVRSRLFDPQPQTRGRKLAKGKRERTEREEEKE